MSEEQCLPPEQARRTFVKCLLLAGLAAIGPACAVQNNHTDAGGETSIEPVKIAEIDALPIGAAVNFTLPDTGDKCVLVRTAEHNFVAYSRRCTHQGCMVVAKPERGCLLCPCHEGCFDLATGDAVSGPPRRALARVQLKIDKNSVYALTLT